VADAGGAERELDDEARPLPGSDSTEIRPPLTSMKPFAIASPNPDPWCDGGWPGER